MTAIRLDPHPVLSAEQERALSESAEVRFSCQEGPSPSSNRIGPTRFVLGHGSDWSPLSHSLKVEAQFKNCAQLACLWGPSQLVPRGTEVVAALEWRSQKTSRRGMSNQIAFSRDSIAGLYQLDFSVDFGPRELLGGVLLAIRLYVGRPGKVAKAEMHLGNIQGFRLGTISPEWEIILDGDGSLFPITHTKSTPKEPLWRFWADWEDPTYDEFSSEYVSLEINEDHPAFKELYGDSKAPYSTFLFRQVLASWLLLFFDELRRKTEKEPIDGGAGANSLLTQWEAIVEGHNDLLLPGSIARAASQLRSKGDLDVSSAETILRTAQVWIDREFNVT